MQNKLLFTIGLGLAGTAAAANTAALFGPSTSPNPPASLAALPPPPPFFGCTAASIQGTWNIGGTITIPSDPSQATGYIASCGPPVPYPISLNATGFTGAGSGPGLCTLGSTINLYFDGSCHRVVGTLIRGIITHNIIASRIGPAATITIVLSAPPANNKYLISSFPEMPAIKARAQVKSLALVPNPTPTTRFTWTSSLSAKRRNGAEVSYGNYLAQDAQTIGESEFTLSFLDPATILGGNLVLAARAIVDQEVVNGQTAAGLEIHGTNPLRADIRSQIDSRVDIASLSGLEPASVKDALKRMACQESNQVQFVGAADGGTGPVLLSSDGEDGVGVFQITSGQPLANNPKVAFDWRWNVSAGVSVFAEKVKSSKNYPRVLRSNKEYRYLVSGEVNRARCDRGLQPIELPTVPKEPLDTYVERCRAGLVRIPGDAPAPDFPLIGSIGSSPANMLLEDAVRAYNGYGKVRNFGTLRLREFTPNIDFLKSVPDAALGSLQTNPNVWRRVPAAERGPDGEPNYVQKVLLKQPNCQ